MAPTPWDMVADNALATRHLKSANEQAIIPATGVMQTCGHLAQEPLVTKLEVRPVLIPLVLL